MSGELKKPKQPESTTRHVIGTFSADARRLRHDPRAIDHHTNPILAHVHGHHVALVHGNDLREVRPRRGYRSHGIRTSLTDELRPAGLRTDCR